MAGNGWMEGNAGTVTFTSFSVPKPMFILTKRLSSPFQSSIAVGKLKCTARTSVVSGRKHPLGRGTVFCHAVRENPEAFGGLAGLGTALPFMNNCIYLDYNATTPIFPEVLASNLAFALVHLGPSWPAGHDTSLSCYDSIYNISSKLYSKIQYSYHLAMVSPIVACCSQVADEMRPCLTKFFGNPSSQHAYGCMVRRCVALWASYALRPCGCCHRLSLTPYCL